MDIAAGGARRPTSPRIGPGRAEAASLDPASQQAPATSARRRFVKRDILPWKGAEVGLLQPGARRDRPSRRLLPKFAAT